MTTHNHNHLAQRNKVLIKFISYHESEEEKEKIIDKHQKKTYHIKCWWKADDRLNANWHPSASSSGPNGHPLPTRMWVCDDKRETNGASTQRGFAIKLSKSSIIAASHTNGCTHCNYCPARGEFAVMLEVEFVWGELESIKALCVIIFGLRTPVWGVRREQQLNLWSNNYVTDSKCIWVNLNLKTALSLPFTLFFSSSLITLISDASIYYSSTCPLNFCPCSLSVYPTLEPRSHTMFLKTFLSLVKVLLLC